MLLAAAPAVEMGVAARSVAKEESGRGRGACGRACSLVCCGATAGAAREKDWGTEVAAVTGCTCGDECEAGDKAAANPDRRLERLTGSTAAVKMQTNCRLELRAAGEPDDSTRTACCDCSRDAAAAFAASVSREGWPNIAGEALCDEIDGAKPENWPCEPGVSERFRPGGGREVESAVPMWKSVLPGGGQTSGTRTEYAAKVMSAVRQYCAAGRPVKWCSS